jgi:serine protease
MKLIVFLIALFSICNSYAQMYEKGQLLVEFKHNADIRSFIQKYSIIETVPTYLKISEKLIPNMNYYILEFDKNISELDFLEYIDNDKDIKLVQINHKLSLRSSIPNDPQFPTQWQYVNTGQGGGTIGMDLDADQAWDLATGGLTAANDTIVVAVIDDGANINHPDLQQNIWTNWREIPNNNLDDDNNGYIDDYLGWNTNTLDDNVNLNGAGPHGTAVAGIIGAVGNNNIGVSGVNWKVKLMLIRNNFNTTEANVLASYGYALTQRKKYNETNGREGSFVVVTNASWGVDNAFPAQAPIWCSFYDSLGKYGILNVASTTNNNVNVDIQGDLPTTCPSDYLIGVTNLNRFGTRNGGFGQQNIDLGAFGDGVFTLNFNNYASFGGTSAATPHVSGTVALAYAAACGEFMSLSRIYPNQAALWMKDAIINGVRPNSILNGSTLSGGQLNMYNTLMEIQNACPLDSCFAPYGLNIYSLTDSNVIIGWAAGQDSACLRIRYKNTQNWIDSIITDQYSYVFNNLSRCKEYEVFVSGFCNGSIGNSERIIFQTQGCCSVPAEIFQNNATDFSAQISWNGPLISSSYNMRWRLYGQATWNFSNTNNNNFQFINLSPCSIYELQVRSDCGDTLSAYTNSFIFSTSGCNSCGQTPYCSMSGTTTDFDWIESFRLADYKNISGKSAGYELFDSIIQTLSAGETVDFSIEQGNNFQEAVRIWIDLNRDNDFNDSDEKVYEGILNFTDSISGLINIPANASPGVTRMRVALQWSTYPTLCTQYQNGETEDYCLRILPNTAVINNDDVNNTFIYPNPTSDFIQIDNIPYDFNEIKIHDITGKLLLYTKNNNNSIKIKMPDNTVSGTYFIKLISQNKSIVKKLIYNKN